MLFSWSCAAPVGISSWRTAASTFMRPRRTLKSSITSSSSSESLLISIRARFSISCACCVIRLKPANSAAVGSLRNAFSRMASFIAFLASSVSTCSSASKSQSSSSSTIFRSISGISITRSWTCSWICCRRCALLIRSFDKRQGNMCLMIVCTWTTNVATSDACMTNFITGMAKMEQLIPRIRSGTDIGPTHPPLLSPVNSSNCSEINNRP
mmetsp:Transcript_41194/g.84273  ORF Transcript_41194/g.84273 Transcript_41194/m.84273 type:complete len:211 (-) Transcript_41194:174-806(-)